MLVKEQLLYGGMDIGSTSCFVVMSDYQGNILQEDRITTTNESIRSYFESVDDPLMVHLEASTPAGHIRYLLDPVVKRVVISHPTENAKIYKNRQKGDRQDAVDLSTLARMGEYTPVWYPDEYERFAFKQVVRNYDTFSEMNGGMKNRIHSRYFSNGVFQRDGSVFDPREREGFINQVPYPWVEGIFRILYGAQEDLAEHKKRARKLMVQVSKEFPEVKLLQTIPGVGPVIACRFVGYIGDPDRFSTRKEIRRYCQLGITEQTSDGKPLGYEKLDPNGRAILKDASFKAFQSAVGRDNGLDRKYRNSLKRTGSKKKARLSTQRKIVDMIWSMWRNFEEYDDDRVTREVS